MNGPSREQAQSNPEPPVPYRCTPIFDEIRLPDALRNVHSLKAGTWGKICILDGQLKLTYCDPHSVVTLSPEQSGLIQPQQLHYVEPLGPIKMRVDFYDRQPGA